MYDMKRLKTWGVAALVLSSVALLSCGGGNQGFGNNSDCDYLILPGFRSGGSFSFTTNRQCPKNYKADFDVRVDFIAPGTGTRESRHRPTSTSGIASARRLSMPWRCVAAELARRFSPSSRAFWPNGSPPWVTRP